MVKLPMYWYGVPLLCSVFYIFYLTGYIKWLIGYYILFLLFSPFLSIKMYLPQVISLFLPFTGISLAHNITSIGSGALRLFILWPIETILWYIDEILFFNYKKQKIIEPVFLIGQPRSGTTKLQSLVNEDDENFVSLLMYEMRYPYLTIQYSIDFFNYIDKVLFKYNLSKLLDKIRFFSLYDPKNERQKMRRLEMNLPDEDDIIFFYHRGFHFLMAAMMPNKYWYKYFHRLYELDDQIQYSLIQFHKRCVQKVLYRRGLNRTYLVKWVAGWNGQINLAKEIYPDAKFICIVRDKNESLPSWIRLFKLLSTDVMGRDSMSENPKLLKTFKKENLIWFHRQIQFCKSLQKTQLLTIKFSQFFQNIPNGIEKIYTFLNKNISQKYKNYLISQNQQQTLHQKTKTDYSDITPQEIQKFPDLLIELFN
eukprot:TRINITY_DN709_c2_g1_i1.p1 TRINITY_DN709_c2_g1~~TRINITY_DN709_c2_g1_i1.p1  ORF type:complete len:423 (-),score=122.25 TRINITY_DN709_c2_g1_i1:84-1352(-)